MRTKLTLLSFLLLVFACVAWAGDQHWKGVVSDSHCLTKHSTAGEGAAACVAKCVAGGAKYVLVHQGKVYQLDAQDKFADFSGKKVKVTGTLSGDSITVTSVEAAPAAGHKKAAKQG